MFQDSCSSHPVGGMCKTPTERKKGFQTKQRFSTEEENRVSVGRWHEFLSVDSEAEDWRAQRHLDWRNQAQVDGDTELFPHESVRVTAD